MKLNVLIITFALFATLFASAIDVNPKNVESSSIDAVLTWQFAFSGKPGAFTFETFDFPNDEFSNSEVVSSTSPFEKNGNTLKFSLPAGENTLSVRWRAVNLKNRVEKVTQTQEELGAYLEESKYVDITPAIKQKAVELTRGEVDELAKATILAQWVHRNVEYDITYSENTITASQVYSARRGVCNEYAHLLTAMLRAIGIPTRFVGGFVYSGEEWAPHAWVEIAHDGKWISFDPTYNEGSVLDGTHFKFADGVDQSYVKEQLSFSKTNGNVAITRSSQVKFTNVKEFSHENAIQIEGNESKSKSGEVVKIKAELTPTFSTIIPLTINTPKELVIVSEKTSLNYVKNIQSVEISVLVPNDLLKGYSYVYPVIISTLGESHNFTVKASKGTPQDKFFLIGLNELRLIEPAAYDSNSGVILSINLLNKGNTQAQVQINVNADHIPSQIAKVELGAGENKEVQIRTNATNFESVNGQIELLVDDQSQVSDFNLQPLKNEQNQTNQNDVIKELNPQNGLQNLILIAVATILILITLYKILLRN